MSYKFKNKKDINKFIIKISNEYNSEIAAKLLNELMNTGFLLATLIGQTISVNDFKKVDVNVAKTMDPETFDKKRKEAIDKFKAQAKPTNQLLYTTDIGAARGFDNVVNMLSTRGYFVKADDKLIDEPVTNSLLDGVDRDEFYNYGNAARKGILDRVKFTAKPGYLFRQLIYAVNVEVDPDKVCNPKGLLKVRIKGNKYLYRYIRQNGKDILLTPENIDQYNDKEVELYSPIFCTLGTNTVCKRCAGELHNILNTKLIGIMAVSVIGEYLYTKLLKSMHTGARASMHKLNMNKLIENISEHKSNNKN